jgi:hypothetical protein
LLIGPSTEPGILTIGHFLRAFGGKMTENGF